MKKYFLIAFILLVFWGCKQNTTSPDPNRIHYKFNVNNSMYYKNTISKQLWSYSFTNEYHDKGYSLDSSTFYFAPFNNNVKLNIGDGIDFDDFHFIIYGNAIQDSFFFKFSFAWKNKMGPNFPDSVNSFATGKIEFDLVKP